MCPAANSLGLNDACLAETLSRIALMTGVGFDLKDIAARLRIDTDVELDPGIIQILQAELGLARTTPRLELQAKLIAMRLSPEEASSLSELVWNRPVEAGIILASRGILNRGSKILQGVPRSTSSACRASGELWRISQGLVRCANNRIRTLAAEAGIEIQDLATVFHAKGNAFSGMDVRVRLPRGKNPFAVA
jgi:hypothetical protein